MKLMNFWFTVRVAKQPITKTKLFSHDTKQDISYKVASTFLQHYLHHLNKLKFEDILLLSIILQLIKWYHGITFRRIPFICTSLITTHVKKNILCWNVLIILGILMISTIFVLCSVYNTIEPKINFVIFCIPVSLKTFTETNVCSTFNISILLVADDFWEPVRKTNREPKQRENKN